MPSTPATVEITLSQAKSGRTLAQGRYELDPELARDFLTRIEAMLTTLDKPVRVTRTHRPDGTTVLEIVAVPSLDLPPALIGPTFEQLYRRPLLVSGECDVNSDQHLHLKNGE